VQIIFGLQKINGTRRNCPRPVLSILAENVHVSGIFMYSRKARITGNVWRSSVLAAFNAEGFLKLSRMPWGELYEKENNFPSHRRHWIDLLPSKRKNGLAHYFPVIEGISRQTPPIACI